MSCLTVILGSREEYGSWKMICSSARRSLRPAFLRRVTSLPMKRICPSVLSRRWTKSLPRVVLPQPDSPTSPSVRPASIVKLTSSTACSIPRVVLKYFFRCLTSSIELTFLTSPQKSILHNEILKYICFLVPPAHIAPWRAGTFHGTCIRTAGLRDPA